MSLSSILSRPQNHQTHIYLSRNQYQTICHDLRKWNQSHILPTTSSCLCSRTRPFTYLSRVTASKYDVDLNTKDGSPTVPDSATLFKILAGLLAIKWIYQATIGSDVIHGYPEVTWADFNENMLQKDEIQEISLFQPDTAVITLKPGASYKEVCICNSPTFFPNNIFLESFTTKYKCKSGFLKSYIF